MEFLVTNYRCLQNPWLGGYRTPDPRSVLCPQLNLLNPPPPQKKILCTPRRGYTHHTIEFWHTRIPSKARGVVSKRTSTHTTCRETTLSPCPLHIRIEIQESKCPPFHALASDSLGHGQSKALALRHMLSFTPSHRCHWERTCARTASYLRWRYSRSNAQRG